MALDVEGEDFVELRNAQWDRNEWFEYAGLHAMTLGTTSVLKPTVIFLYGPSPRGGDRRRDRWR